MRGYGDPEAGGLGYGDPESLAGTVQELGYGDPSQEALIYLELRDSRAHHRGGAPLHFAGPLSDHLAPYRLSIDVGGVTTYLYSGIAGQGPNIFKRRGELEAYSPPAPAGSYILTLHCGPNFGLQFPLSTPLIIEPDNRGNQRYSARRSAPHLYQTGARYNALDPLDLATAKPQRPPYMHQLLDIFGRLTQELSGTPQTVLARDHQQGETALELESLYSFALKGEVIIEGDLYPYTISGSQLTLGRGLKRALPQLSEVIINAA